MLLDFTSLLLILSIVGAGESGKSTVLKQMKLIHASGFDETEREGFRVIVYSNIMLAMQILFEVVEQLNIPLQHTSNAVSLSFLNLHFFKVN
jgi:guanine nucleotide-binding protein subunit alpha